MIIFYYIMIAFWINYTYIINYSCLKLLLEIFHTIIIN